MHNTDNIERIAGALVGLIGYLNSPQRDDLLLREAGVVLDRALFPLLVRLGVLGPLSVGDLAAQAGRDHTTISRQLARLEALGLISRESGGGDRRVRAAALTDAGRAVVGDITAARRRLLSRALGDWPEQDLALLATLNQRFLDALVTAAEG